ncbi:hypothetical protein K438DRAFT_1778519 [Mycena galopus ATCC 62051]|nr:hypothetical protein K438DRAFT_1778519 [Mycena galopus ATCC 62051]
MQFFLVAFLAVLSTIVSASPINPLLNRAGTCNVNTCVAALAPAFPTDCNPAVTQQGANTALNTACLAAAAKGTAPFPTACTPCASQFGVTDPANKAVTANNNANGAPAAGTPAPAESAQNAPAAAPPVSSLSGRRSLRARLLSLSLEPTTLSTPSACAGCAAQFGVTDPGSVIFEWDYCASIHYSRRPYAFCSLKFWDPSFARRIWFELGLPVPGSLRPNTTFAHIETSFSPVDTSLNSLVRRGPRYHEGPHSRDWVQRANFQDPDRRLSQHRSS